MTETSRPWSNEAVGDGVLSPYDNAEWSTIWRVLFQRDRTVQGYIEGYLNELEVINPAGNSISMDTGAALVDGKFYEEDGVGGTPGYIVVAPVGATRIDRVVLRKIWATQTVRQFIISGIEGGGIPALIQNDGVTWDIPLAQVSITVGNVITVTDEREASRTPLAADDTSTMVLIETIVADGASATIDFSSIPQIYRQLFITGQIRFAGAIVEATLEVQFNGDVGANYNDQQTIGENAAATAVANTGNNQGIMGEMPAGNGIANHAGEFQSWISNYSETDFFKNWLGTSISIPNLTVADFSVRHAAGLWEDQSAINQIVLLSTTGASGNIVAESTVSLYGVR